jgi:hypothetical protein
MESMDGAAGVFTATMQAGLLLKRSLFRLVHRWSSVTGTSVDDIAGEAIRQPFTLWVLMLAIHLATHSSQLPQRYAELLTRVLLVLWIVSLTVVAARIASSVVRRYGPA